MNLIERWAQAQDLGPVSNNRKFSVTFDQVRLHLLETHPGLVVVQARVSDIPVQPTQRERAIERAMHIAFAQANKSSSNLTVDEDQSAFWLQRQLDMGARLEELDQAVEGLINDIELWRTAF